MKRIIWNLITAGIAILQLIVLSREFKPYQTVEPGGDGQVLTIDATSSQGVKWADMGGGGGGSGCIYTYTTTGNLSK